MNSERGLISTPSISQGIALLQELKQVVPCVQNFRGREDAGRLECLVAKTFGHILHLPVYSGDYQGQKEKYHVHWPGSINGSFKTAPAGPDAFVCAHDFHCLLEATFSTGNSQWSRHFGREIDHLDRFVDDKNLSRSEVYSVFVAGDVSPLTFTSLRAANVAGYKIIPLDLSSLALLLEPSIYTYALCHFVFRNLLDDIMGELDKSSGVKDYAKRVKKLSLAYRREIMDGERTLFLGLCLCRVFVKYERDTMSASEILAKVRRDGWVKGFRKLSKKPFDTAEIEECLLSLGLACKHKLKLAQDSLFEPVSRAELKGRANRILKVLEEVNYDS